MPLASSSGWSRLRIQETSTRTVMPELLEGDAALWFRNNRTRRSKWSESTKNFNNFFYPVNYQEEFEVEISRRLQRQHEPANTYLTEMRTLIRRHGDLTESQGLNWLHRNLLPEYRLQICKSDYSDAESLAIAIRHHKILQKELRRRAISVVIINRQHPPAASILPTPGPRRPLPRSQQVPVRSLQGPPASILAGTICWRCGKSEHYRPSCKNPPKIFCLRCRRDRKTGPVLINVEVSGTKGNKPRDVPESSQLASAVSRAPTTESK